MRKADVIKNQQKNIIHPWRYYCREGTCFTTGYFNTWEEAFAAAFEHVTKHPKSKW